MWIKENRTDSEGCGAMVIGPAGENQVRFTAEDDHLPKRFTSEVLPETKKPQCCINNMAKDK